MRCFAILMPKSVLAAASRRAGDGDLLPAIPIAYATTMRTRCSLIGSRALAPLEIGRSRPNAAGISYALLSRVSEVPKIVGIVSTTLPAYLTNIASLRAVPPPAKGSSLSA